MQKGSFDSDNVSTELDNILTEDIQFFKNKNLLYSFILSVFDLTSLEGSDNSSSINTLCNKALYFNSHNLPSVAAVCVYPNFIKEVKENLAGSKIKTVSVAGGFPSAQMPLNIRLQEVEYAINEGADEIDMVISRGKFLEKDYPFVFEEIRKTKNICGNKLLKVIIEVGELLNYDNIYEASMIAMNAGADFIKTSTGKISISATPDSAFIMAIAINDFYKATGKKTGFKVAGGISSLEDAIKYVKIIEKKLGNEWLNSNLFRIGTSRLADKMIQEFKI